MKFIFFGSDEFSVKVLEVLADQNLQPELIVTVPDRPQGRKLILTPPPAKVWAEAREIEVFQPTSLKKPETLLLLLSAGQASDFALVASYGKIIPSDILSLPQAGTLNIHPSLLPKYRGPSPLETAILDGAPETGTTIIKLDAEMDHGPVLAQKSISLTNQFTYTELRDKLAVLGAELLLEILPDYLAGKLQPQVQDHSQATYTKKFTKADGRLDPEASVLDNYRKIMALNPWPGAYLEDENGTHLKIKSAHLKDGALIYDRVVPAGGREMSWADFRRGQPKLNPPDEKIS